MFENETLKKYSFFGGLNEEQLSYVRSMLREERYAPGEIILREGTLNSKVFFIQEGQVGIDKIYCGADTASDCETRHIADLHVGDTFGEMEVIDIQPCVATVTASSEVCLLTLSNIDLYALRKRDLKAFTLMIMNVARDISRRLRVMDSRFSEFSGDDAQLPPMQ